MPLFGWMRWAWGEAERVEGAPPQAGGSPGYMLMQELFWHVEERERLAREVERAHRLSRGTLCYPSLHALIPPSKRRRLEHLCAQIQPTHTQTVLARFRGVLATNNIFPWELVYVFEQVLKDFLQKEEEEEEEEERSQLAPVEAWASQCKMKQGFETPMLPDCGDPHREEIPTISSYVDRSMRAACPYTAHRDWDLPYYYPVPFQCPEAYSTTL